jgi:hypothetical protein
VSTAKRHADNLPVTLKPNETGDLKMATLMIKDLTANTELDSKAMAAVAGGYMPMDMLGGLILNYTGISTSFPVHNDSKQLAIAENRVGAFNFGNVSQSNNQVQISGQVGNVLTA